MFGDTILNIEEFTIKEYSCLNNRFIDEFNFSKDFNIIIIGILDKELGNNFIFNSNNKNHKLDEGDTLVAIGYRENLIKFGKYIEAKQL